VRGVLAQIRAELDRLKAEPMATADRAEAARFAWYAPGCPCGLAAGSCREHPRARPSQRPPAGDWRTWLVLAGRGFGKTRSAAEWIRHRVETGAAHRVALVGATAADVRDVMVEGPSGILAVCPPWDRPRYEPSKRRLTWPNGAVATTFSADEPDRLRGPQSDCAWLDELAAFRYPMALDNLLFGLRLGADPRLCVTTTPKPVRLVTELVSDPTTAIARGTTYENRAHLAASFFDRIVCKYEGTRLGQQELLAEILEVSDGAWFKSFDAARHVTDRAEYEPGFPVHLAIDCGVSRHVAAVWFQVRPVRYVPALALPERGEARVTPGGWVLPPAVPMVAEHGLRSVVTVFGDFHVEGVYSEAAARAIVAHGQTLPGCGGRPDLVRLDPAASARTGIGPTAYSEFERVFGSSILARWPSHRVLDGLDQLEVLLDQGCLLLHPRCSALKAAFQNYARRRTPGGDWQDEPADPQHPHEDLLDALRGGVRDRFPEGRIEQPGLRTVHA
jgi:Terminase large subunit, T4likevirus-type, N-terminal